VLPPYQWQPYSCWYGVPVYVVDPHPRCRLFGHRYHIRPYGPFIAPWRWY
jgi:hypothetical protein